MTHSSEPNSLIHSTSPYLLQHAYNPVHWYQWGEEALNKAISEDKLLLISIGYSACHWCHVMERESFENDDVATVMNKFFVCIKVDREERPDIDQVYMEAVQLMTGRGGWPLNCIALPDQRPIYGGTYFPREQWQSVLLQVATFYRNDREKCKEYASELTAGIRQIEYVKTERSDVAFKEIPYPELMDRWVKQFDLSEGGNNQAPKFPMPDQYRYLLQYWFYFRDDRIKKHLQLSLTKMAFGGIFDQLGGGFSRYSVDGFWKVPHFEKMLYDNAQLITLYSEAWQAFQVPLYKEVVLETLQFIKREMSSPAGGYYSALDADSEGVEGLFYTWTKDELREILGEQSQLFFDYYNVNSIGFWEEERYILLRKKEEDEIAKLHGISVEELRKALAVMKEKVMQERGKRIRPGLDDKILCSWNALMLKSYCDAYAAFGNEEYLISAQRNASFILNHLQSKSGALMHSCKDPLEGVKSIAAISGFLEDYAFSIEAFTRLYQVSFDEKYLEHAVRWMNYALENFSDDHDVLFYFTSGLEASLITRKMEIQDNVIPASTAVMAHNLFILGTLTVNQEWIDRSRRMINSLKDEIIRSTPWYCRWAQVMLLFTQPVYELVMAGKQSKKAFLEWGQSFHPDIITAGAVSSSDLPLLAGRLVADEQLFYLCQNQTCQLPVKSMEELAQMLQNKG